MVITICCDVTFMPVRVGVDDDCDDVDDMPDDRCGQDKKKPKSSRNSNGIHAKVYVASTHLSD